MVIVLAAVLGVLLLGLVILVVDAYREDSEAGSDEWQVTRVDGQLRWERGEVTYIDTDGDDRPDLREEWLAADHLLVFQTKGHWYDLGPDDHFILRYEYHKGDHRNARRIKDPVPVPDLPVPAGLREAGRVEVNRVSPFGLSRDREPVVRYAPEPEPEEIRPLLPARAPAPLEPETGEQVYNWKNAGASFIHGDEWSVSTLSDRRIAMRAAGDDEGRIELEYGPFSRWYFRARGRDSVSVAKRLTSKPPRGARDDFEPGVASESTVGGATSYRLDKEVRIERRQRVTTVYIPVDSRHLFVATYTRDADAEDTATQAAFERLLETLQFGNRWRPER